MNDMKIKKQRILILAPHTDDGELGCGGSIARLTEEGHDVYYAAFSTAEQSLPPGFPPDTLEVEVKAATKVLGINGSNLIIYKHEVRKLNYIRQEILEEMVQLRKDIKPTLIFMPSPNDLHQDHHTVSEEGVRAFKTSSILGYELLWNNISFNTQSFMLSLPPHIRGKLNALKEYKSQYQRKYLTKEFIEGWARTRGTQINAEYAEAFEVIRWII
ncbi:MAG: PIG-L family deacetylase [Bacteroidetes bacterium]|nr:PIG-L family deacetylase [Bacteroidota bacterium]